MEDRKPKPSSSESTYGFVNSAVMAQIGEKPNPNNPIVFFDITVGNTVSSLISSHKILKLTWFKWFRLMLLPRIRELKGVLLDR